MPPPINRDGLERARGELDGGRLACCRRLERQAGRSALQPPGPWWEPPKRAGISAARGSDQGEHFSESDLGKCHWSNPLSGREETKASIANKLARATMTAHVFLASMVASGQEQVTLEDI